MGAVALLMLGGTGWLAWRSEARREPTREELGNAAEPQRATSPRATASRAPSANDRHARSEPSSTIDAPSVPPRGPGILVVDADGTPRAGVPVQVVERAAYGVSRKWSETTDPRGFAPFPADLAKRLDDVSEESQILATFDFPLARPQEVEIEVDAIPAEPLLLQLPATGSFE